MHECVCFGANMPVPYHDGSYYNSAVLHARSVIRKQRRVLDQHQFVCIVPVADLQRKQSMRLCICVHVFVLIYCITARAQLAMLFWQTSFVDAIPDVWTAQWSWISWQNWMLLPNNMKESLVLAVSRNICLSDPKADSYHDQNANLIINKILHPWWKSCIYVIISINKEKYFAHDQAEWSTLWDLYDI